MKKRLLLLVFLALGCFPAAAQLGQVPGWPPLVAKCKVTPATTTITTTGSFSYTVPCYNTITIELWGPGGKGGSGSTFTGGSGAGGGAYGKHILSAGVLPTGSNLTGVVGAAGTATTILSLSLTANSGSVTAGGNASGFNTTNTTGTNGSANSGTTGGDGGAGANGGAGGNGGALHNGGGGGTVIGGGGGGGGAGNSPIQPGGSGARGQAKITVS